MCFLVHLDGSSGILIRLRSCIDPGGRHAKQTSREQVVALHLDNPHCGVEHVSVVADYEGFCFRHPVSVDRGNLQTDGVASGRCARGILKFDWQMRPKNMNPPRILLCGC